MSDPRNSPPASADFEDTPLTRSEYITAMVHMYRGEMTRANTWRMRLDTTTNWAVVTTGAMLSLAFSDREHDHFTLLLANVLVLMFLAFEARRFRYFDVWRSRIRMMEENFFLPMIRRDLVSPRQGWRQFVAEDLDHPTFKTTFLQAAGTRLRRNYLGVFAVILVAWLAKLNIPPVSGWAEIWERMRVGPIPGPVVLAIVTSFWILLISVAALRNPKGRSDEVIGVERAMDHWKT